MYHIEYVTYWQGPYRIRIVSAADRIVPALVPLYFAGKLTLYEYLFVHWSVHLFVCCTVCHFQHCQINDVS